MEHSGKPQLEIAEQVVAAAARDPFMRFLVASAANKDEGEIPRVRRKNNLLFKTRTSVWQNERDSYGLDRSERFNNTKFRRCKQRWRGQAIDDRPSSEQR